MWLAAVRQNGFVLKLHESLKTEAICLAAVKEDGCALQFVPETMKTEHICLLALQRNSEAFKYVPEHLKARVKEEFLKNILPEIQQYKVSVIP
jgi:hypothetical protein